MSAPDPAVKSIPETASTSETGVGRKSLSFGLRIVCALGGGLAFAACFPPIGMPALLPVAVVVLLRLLEGVTVRQAAYIGLACGMVFFGMALFWLTDLFGQAAITLWALCAIFPMLFCALFVWLRGVLPHFPVWLLAAVVWTAIETFRSEWMIPSFGFLGLGYAVVNAPWAVAPASLFGCYGLTFAVVALSAVLPRSGARGIILLACWLALLLLPRPIPMPDRPFTVRLIQANSEDDESLFRLSQPAPSSHFDVIVWPEYSFVSDPTQNPKLWGQLTQLAQQSHSYLLFGAKNQFDTRNEAAYRNTAFLLDPQGRLVARHVKNHTIPFMRDGVAGTRAQAFDTAFGRIGIAICFDLDFPDVARRLTNAGAEALLVPSDNPAEWGGVQRVQHRQMFQMRAVECGRWIATADVAGNTGLFAPTGREVTRVATAEPTGLTVQVGRQTGKTLFVRGGWRFGPACLLALLALCGWAMRHVLIDSKR